MEGPIVPREQYQQALKRLEQSEAKRAKDAVGRGVLFYKLTVKDNGSGMPHTDIPNMLGRVLSGTKYGACAVMGACGRRGVRLPQSS